jgi:hypothetical protein
MARSARRDAQKSRRRQKSPTAVDITAQRLEVLAEQLAAASEESQAIARVVRADLTEALQDAVVDPVARKKDD